MSIVPDHRLWRHAPGGPRPQGGVAPRLQRELAAILATGSPTPSVPALGQRWEDWVSADAPPWGLEGPPSLWALLLWDNLQGHHH